MKMKKTNRKKIYIGIGLGAVLIVTISLAYLGAGENFQGRLFNISPTIKKYRTITDDPQARTKTSGNVNDLKKIDKINKADSTVNESDNNNVDNTVENDNMNTEELEFTIVGKGNPGNTTGFLDQPILDIETRLENSNNKSAFIKEISYLLGGTCDPIDKIMLKAEMNKYEPMQLIAETTNDGSFTIEDFTSGEPLEIKPYEKQIFEFHIAAICEVDEVVQFTIDGFTIDFDDGNGYVQLNEANNYLGHNVFPRPLDGIVHY